MSKIDNIIEFATSPLVIIRRAGATIFVILNIWLFSGVARILEGVMNLDFSETFAVTLSASLVLLSIAGTEKAYAASDGKMTEIEKTRIIIMWLTGIGLYLWSTGYAVYGAIDVIENKQGRYSYSTFDWFGLITPTVVNKVINYTSLTFTLGKVAFSIALDYIAGTLIDKEVAAVTNSFSPPNNNHHNKNKLTKASTDVLTRIEDLVKMSDDEVAILLGDKAAIYKEKSRLLGYNDSNFTGHPTELEKFKVLKEQLRTKLADVIKNATFP